LAEAEKAVLWYKEVFGDDYYIELQRHKTDKPNADYECFEKQQRQNAELIKLARKTSTKLVATNDVHFVEEEHGEAHERLICLSTGKDLDDPTRMPCTCAHSTKALACTMASNSDCDAKKYSRPCFSCPRGARVV
jgi:DNA polymerase-3 subunit alpha